VSRVGLGTIAREWGRIGCIGFGGPPAHIALLRRLCVEDRRWLDAGDFEDAVAAVNLLPGPASTQLAIYCAWRLGGPAGALVGGACFICPGLACILLLAWLFLSSHPPLWLRGAAAGAAAAVPAVALYAAVGLLPASWRRARAGAGSSIGGEAGGSSDGASGSSAAGGSSIGGDGRSSDQAGGSNGGGGSSADRRSSVTAELLGRGGAGLRFAVWLAAGAAAAVASTPLLVLVLLACGLTETALRRGLDHRAAGAGALVWLESMGKAARVAGAGVGAGGLGAVAWVAFQVGALSYGEGFVIVPLMQHDAVVSYHWMSGAHFLDAVALGQVTPGPVVLTVAVVGYAARGVGGALLATLVAFAPSFAFVLVGGAHLDRLRGNTFAQGFFAGAGPAAIGAIAGASVPLARDLPHLWQLGVLATVSLWLLCLRRSIVSGIAGAALAGVAAALAGAPVPR
jgi:chromate transporter